MFKAVRLDGVWVIRLCCNVCQNPVAGAQGVAVWNPSVGEGGGPCYFVHKYCDDRSKPLSMDLKEAIASVRQGIDPLDSDEQQAPPSA